MFRHQLHVLACRIVLRNRAPKPAGLGPFVLLAELVKGIRRQPSAKPQRVVGIRARRVLLNESFVLADNRSNGGQDRGTRQVRIVERLVNGLFLCLEIGVHRLIGLAEGLNRRKEHQRQDEGTDGFHRSCASTSSK